MIFGLDLLSGFLPVGISSLQLERERPRSYFREVFLKEKHILYK